MKFRPNAPLLIGIGLPVLMVLLVAASIYLPSLFTKKPVYNFVYSVPSDPYPYSGAGYSAYAVENGKLIEQQTPDLYLSKDPGKPVIAPTKPSLYIHDATTNVSRQITFDEARTLTLDGNSQSPDGFTIVNSGYDGGGIVPFFGGYPTGRNYYIKKGSYSRELNINQSNNFDYYSFRFVGWVL